MQVEHLYVANSSLSVDIYHITAQHPRFANVSYSDPESGRTAINTLHNRPIDLGNDPSEDLNLWRDWQGQLTVVVAEPGRLVPTSATAAFPSLPDWAVGGSRDQREENEVDLQVSEPSPGRKRHTSEYVSHHSPLMLTTDRPHRRQSALGPNLKHQSKSSPLTVLIQLTQRLLTRDLTSLLLPSPGTLGLADLSPIPPRNRKNTLSR